MKTPAPFVAADMTAVRRQILTEIIRKRVKVTRFDPERFMEKSHQHQMYLTFGFFSFILEKIHEFTGVR